MQVAERDGILEAVTLDGHRQVHTRHDDGAARKARAAEKQLRFIIRRAYNNLPRSDFLTDKKISDMI